MNEDLITPAQAAHLKQVSRTAVYRAIQEGRLRGELFLGRLALRKADVLSWEPQRPGAPRPSAPMSEESKRKLSETQKKRWMQRKNESP